MIVASSPGKAELLTGIGLVKFRLHGEGARTARATWPLTTYPPAKRPGICQDSYSPEHFETMKSFTHTHRRLPGHPLRSTIRLTGRENAPSDLFKDHAGAGFL